MTLVCRPKAGLLLLACLISVLAASGANAQVVNTTPSTKIGTAPLISPSAAAAFYGSSTTSTLTANLTPQNEIVELARAVNTGSPTTTATAIFQYIRDNVDTVWMYGLQKGGVGVIVDRSGTAFDQAALMVQVLTQDGITASYQVGTASPTPQQFQAWTGLTSASAACQLLANGGIPASINGTTQADCNYGSATITSISFSHVWVKAVIGGSTYLYDPSLKPRAQTAGQLAAIGGLPASPLAQATTGMTTGAALGVGFVSNLNATQLNATLQSYGVSVQNWIDANAPAGKVEDIVGGSHITLATSAELTPSSTLPYTSSLSTSWAGIAQGAGVPDLYRTALRVKVSRLTTNDIVLPLFDVPLFVDEIYGRKLMVFSRAHGAGGYDTDKLEVVDEFGAAVTVGAGPATADEPGQNDATIVLTVNHPYAASATPSVVDGSYMDAVVTKHATMWMPLVIAHSWGDADKRLVDKWGAPDDSQAPGGVTGGVCDVCDLYVPTAGDGRRAQLTAAWMAQSTKAARLHAAIANSTYTHHHSVGVAAADTEIQTVYVDPLSPNSLKGYAIRDSFDRLDIDTAFSLTSNTANATDRRAAVHAIAVTLETLEGSVAAQISDLPDTTSTPMRFEWGNQPPGDIDGDGAPDAGGTVPRKVYDFTNGADASQAAQLVKFQGKVATAATGTGTHTRTTPTFDTGEAIQWTGALASAIGAYTGAGFDVVASEEAFLGPGQRAGAFVSGQGAGAAYFSHIPTHQRGGVLVATRYVAGDPVEIAHIAVGLRDRAKGGGGGAQAGHQAQYDPSKAADVLKARFVDHSSALGVDLAAGSVVYTSPASLSVGQGEFPYKLDAELIWRGGENRTTAFGPLGQTEPSGPWTSNWNNTLTVSGSGIEAMGDTDVRTAAGSIAAFVALQDVYKAAPSAQREVAATLVGAWWAHQLSGNVVTVSVGAGSQQFVRRIAGDWLAPGPGPYATLTQTGARTLIDNGSCGSGYVQTRGWNYSGLSFDVGHANGDSQHFDYWSNSIVNGAAFCRDYHGFRLTRWTFPQGVTINVAYAPVSGSLDVISQVSNNLGRKIVFTNGGVAEPGKVGGFTNGLSGADARAVSISEDGAQHTDPNGKVTSFTVSTLTGRYHLDAVYAADDAAHAALSYTYDSLGRVKTASDRLAGEGARNPYEFRIADALRGERKDPLGGRYTVYYDTNKHPLRFVDELGQLTSATYDGRGRATSYTYPEADQELFEYDNHNNTTKLTKVSKTPGTPANIVIQASWDQTWNKPLSITPLSFTDGLNRETDFTYVPAGSPGAGQMLTALRPAPVAGGARPTYTFSYTSFGQLQTSQDPTGLLVQNTYDAANYLWKTAVDPGTVNAVTTFTNNGLGDPTSIDGPRLDVSDVSTIAYDNMRRRRLEVQPDTGDGRPVATQTTYDEVGRAKLVEQGYAPGGAFTALKATTFHFDPDGNKVAEIVSGGGATYAATNYAYDALNRVACSAVRMNSATFTADLDACTLGAPGGQGPDRLSQTTYDAVGQVLTINAGYKSALEQVMTTYTWSPNGKRTSIKDAENNLTTYSYDGFDRLSQINYPSRTKGLGQSVNDLQAYTYDPNGNRLTYRTRANDTIIYQYDALDRLISKTGLETGNPVYNDYDAAGRLTYAHLGTSGGSGVQFHYDTAGRQDQETSFGRTIYSAYDPVGNRTRVTWPDAFYVDYVYDAANRLKEVREKGVTTGPGRLASLTYGDLNERTGVSRGNGTSAIYGYDPIARLNALTQGALPATAASIQTMAYNPASQIVHLTQATAAYVWTGQPTTTSSYAANGQNQDAAIAAVPNSYDTKGDLVADGTHVFLYDKQTRLTNVKTAQGAQLLAITYDPLDRIRQTTNGSGAVTQFLYDGDRLVAEYNGAGTTPLHRYVHGTGVDEPLVWYVGGDTSSRRWLQADRQGSIIGWSDVNGAVTAYTYGPYGEPQDWSGPRFRYTGQIALPEAQIYHYKARGYDPARGWFLQTDPIGQQDDPNLYAYVKDDPTDRTDPTGLYESNPILLALVPGQASFDHGVTNLENGHPLAAAANFGAMVAEQVLSVATLGESQVAARGTQAVTGTAERAVGRDALTSKQTQNLARFEKKVPANSGETTLTKAKDGSVKMEATSPGKVPGSSATYSKTVNPEGKTTSYVKTTRDPDGNIVHVKDKLNP